MENLCAGVQAAHIRLLKVEDSRACPLPALLQPTLQLNVPPLSNDPSTLSPCQHEDPTPPSTGIGVLFAGWNSATWAEGHTSATSGCPLTRTLSCISCSTAFYGSPWPTESGPGPPQPHATSSLPPHTIPTITPPAHLPPPHCEPYPLFAPLAVQSPCGPLVLLSFLQQWPPPFTGHCYLLGAFLMQPCANLLVFSQERWHWHLRPMLLGFLKV